MQTKSFIKYTGDCITSLLRSFRSEQNWRVYRIGWDSEDKEAYCPYEVDFLIPHIQISNLEVKPVGNATLAAFSIDEAEEQFLIKLLYLICKFKDKEFEISGNLTWTEEDNVLEINYNANWQQEPFIDEDGKESSTENIANLERCFSYQPFYSEKRGAYDRQNDKDIEFLKQNHDENDMDNIINTLYSDKSDRYKSQEVIIKNQFKDVLKNRYSKFKNIDEQPINDEKIEEIAKNAVNEAFRFLKK